jgi:hypothetical protein
MTSPEGRQEGDLHCRFEGVQGCRVSGGSSAGRLSAKARGMKLGRRPKLNAHQMREAERFHLRLQSFAQSTWRHAFNSATGYEHQQTFLPACCGKIGFLYAKVRNAT